jgi:hypothetical protein
MTWLDHFACALVDQAAIQSEPVAAVKCQRLAEADDALRRSVEPPPPNPLAPHLTAVLAIVRRTGGYMDPEDQAVLRAATAAVAGIRECGNP